MSIFQRIFQAHHQPSPAPLLLDESEVSPRMRYPKGPFAALITVPEHLADLAYEVFDHYRLTPGTAERQIARVLAAGEFSCLPVETSPAYAWQMARETTDLGQLRVFCEVLVRMQFQHEMNLRELRIVHGHGVRRVRILPGCCDICDRVARRDYRVAEAPTLPVHGCTRIGGCKCAWVPVAGR
jgi:hypothetical protein